MEIPIQKVALFIVAMFSSLHTMNCITCSCKLASYMISFFFSLMSIKLKNWTSPIC